MQGRCRVESARSCVFALFLVLALPRRVRARANAACPPPRFPDPSALPQAAVESCALPGADHRECGPSKWSALCAAGRWTHFSRIDLRVSAPGFAARYEIEQAENGEMHATYREQAGRTVAVARS